MYWTAMMKWHYKCALIRIAQFLCSSTGLNWGKTVIYYRLRNIGPATAGSAGPVPVPL